MSVRNELEDVLYAIHFYDSKKESHEREKILQMLGVLGMMAANELQPSA